MAFARIWTLEPAANALVLQASAGLYKEIDGAYSRIPVGKTRIGKIAESHLPLISHDVQSDPDTADHEWAEREGMISFAGHPLMVRSQVFGVVAVFGQTPLADATMWALSAIANQIAQFIEARRAEQALKRSEELARRLFSSIPHPAYVFDLDTHEFLEVNKIALERYQYTRAEFLAMKTSDLHSRDEIEQLKEYLQSDPDTDYAGEWKHCTKDGHTINVEITYDVIDYGGRRAGLAIAQDVTERKKMEVDLRHSQKLESVGRLASGIAHEINTPIQFVGDNLRFLSDAFGDLLGLLDLHRAVAGDAARGAIGAARLNELEQAVEASDLDYLNEEIPRALSQSMDGVGRVATIVKAMKEFAHPQLNQKARANLNDALASTLVVARNELKYVADVETDFGELPLVECNISDLNQVFLNLLVNAAHAIGEVVNGTGKKGKIRVRTRFDGEWVHIAIGDTGCGIPEQIRDNVFDPFFTTKDVGRGTGQGLAISRSIVVEKHGGTLTFETEVGQGTTFLIGLPVSQAELRKS
jgi:PAS domain S-box-containing protein